MELRQEIERMAYELYEKKGFIPGQDLDHWLEAEKIVQSRVAAGAAAGKPLTAASAEKAMEKNIVGKRSKKPVKDSRRSKQAR